ncbi:MAG: PAS domain-containing sensor histidine kinase, partial [Candidatus Promineifilaceae bacterium]
AVEGSTSGITIADATVKEMPLVYANPSFYSMTGYTPDEVIGRNCRFLQGSEPNQPAIDVLRHALRHGEPCRVELCNYRKDGTLFHNDLHLYPLHNPSGKLTHYVGIQNDVTERREMERRLRKSEARYRAISQLTTDYVYTLTINAANKLQNNWIAGSVEELTGYSIDELTAAQGWAVLIHAEDRQLAQAQIAQVFKGQDDVREFRILTKDKQIKWIRNYAKPIINEQSKRVVQLLGAVQDITATKNAQVDLIKAEGLRAEVAKEREIVGAQERFITSVSHDFRTPLSVISMNAGLLQAKLAKTSPKMLRYLDRVQTQVASMTELLDGVLHYSRGQAGKLELQPQLVDLRALCLELIQQVKMVNSAEHTIQFNYICPQTTYNLDESILRKIIINLISNALKYAPDHNPITFSVDYRNQQIELQIQDQGIGIPQAEQHRLFEPFFRAQNVSGIQGTGLGLAIVKQSAEAHGGDVTCVSEINKGTLFIVTLSTL